MMADARYIAGKPAACLEVAFVVGERFGDADRTSALDAAARQHPRLVLRLPEVDDALAVGVLEVVGDPRQVLGPVTALAVGDAHHPGAAVLAAPVRERHPGCDG